MTSAINKVQLLNKQVGLGPA